MSKISRLSALVIGLVILNSSLPAVAIAQAPEAAKKAGGAKDEVSEKEIARSVELSGLILPMFDERGVLKNYMFVNVRMLVAEGKDTWKFREKSHLIRDAVIRAAHRKSFNVAGDFFTLDEKLAAAEILKAGNEAVGAPAFVEMKFTQIASQKPS